MSVLSRTPRAHTGRQPEQVLPRQRTSSPALPPGSPPGPRRRRRAAGLLSAGVLVAAVAGTGLTVLIDDRSSSGAPARTAVEISGTELARDRAMENRPTSAQILRDRIAHELRRDLARAGANG